MLGFDREQDIINLGDTAEVYAHIFSATTDDPVPQDDLAAVSFTIQKPSGARITQAGEISADGQGLLRFNGADEVGHYTAIATFTFSDGVKRSSRADFEVIDPFNPPAPTPVEVVAQAVWNKLKDCFDAEDEGPWLRDMTLNTFNEASMGSFIRDSLFGINQQHPPTALGLENFVIEQDGQTMILEANFTLLVKACFIEVLKHMIRSYVEQPLPQGAQIVYEDRRDYMTRWGQVYQLELESYKRDLALWKRQFLGLGQTRILVSAKAGRLTPAPMRSRFIGRGYWAVTPTPLLLMLADRFF